MKRKVATFSYIHPITLSDEVVADCSRSGNVGDSIAHWVEQPEVKKEMDRLHNQQLKKELSEYGAWSDEELESHEENLKRILWIACGNIAEGDYDEEE